MTRYEIWQREKNEGSFHTHLFQAYQVADEQNRNRIASAFSELFINDNELSYAEASSHNFEEVNILDSMLWIHDKIISNMNGFKPESLTVFTFTQMSNSSNQNATLAVCEQIGRITLSDVKSIVFEKLPKLSTEYLKDAIVACDEIRRKKGRGDE